MPLGARICCCVLLLPFCNVAQIVAQEVQPAAPPAVQQSTPPAAEPPAPALPVAIPLAASQQGTITGKVVDIRGDAIASAQIKLSLDARAPDQETQSTQAGNFSFSNVPPGPFHISFDAAGFAVKTIDGELQAGESLTLPRTELAIDVLATQVNVSETQVELAQAQIKIAEQQRLVGVIPNYFANYDPTVVSLNARQKFELTWKTFVDPAAFVYAGFIAGIWQAEDTYHGFGQGAEGYGKRVGAAYADWATGLMLEAVIMPTIFKQDPRYFYKGTGSTSSRIWYALSRTFICQGDNRKAQFCYSSVIGDFASPFISNYYYPPEDRNTPAANLRSGALNIGFSAAYNLFQEFLAKKLTKKKS